MGKLGCSKSLCLKPNFQVTVSRSKRKQRKHIYTANAHERAVMMSVRLSRDLRKRYSGIKTMPVKVGDTVKVMTGTFNTRHGKVKRVQRREYRIYIEKISHDNSRGQTKEYPIHPSNCIITKLNLEHGRKKLLNNRLKNRGRDLLKKVDDEGEDDAVDEEEDAVPDLVQKQDDGPGDVMDEGEDEGEDDDDDAPPELEDATQS